MQNKQSNYSFKLVEKGQIYHWMYRNQLASHLPMALFSLNYMGASNKQLVNFYEFSITRKFILFFLSILYELCNYSLASLCVRS